MQKVNFNKSLYHEKVLKDLRNPRTNEERKRICLMLFYAMEGLLSVGINIYPNIIELFRINGFKRSSFYIDAILSIVEKITLITKVNFTWLKRRTLQKANNEEKNIVLCYLLFVYQQYFIGYLKDFLLQNKSNEEKVQKLIASLQRTLPKCPSNNNNNNNNNDNINNIQLSAKFNIYLIKQEQENQKLENQNSEHQNLQNQNSEHKKLENQNSEHQEQENQNSEEVKLENKPLTKEENELFYIGHDHNNGEFLFNNCFGFENSLDLENDLYFNNGYDYDNGF